MREIKPATRIETSNDDIQFYVKEFVTSVECFAQIGHKKIVAHFSKGDPYDPQTLIDQVVTKYFPELDDHADLSHLTPEYLERLYEEVNNHGL